MSRKRYWQTASGVVVFESVEDRRLWSFGDAVQPKIAAYRADTGGWHGWLWLKNLTPAKAPKRVTKQKSTSR